jgi:hypothetical protein
MPTANPSAATAAMSHDSLPDTHQLIALLDSVMPLLLRFQSQTVGPSFGPTPPLVAIADPILDRQAAVNLVENIVGDALRTLGAYLETYARTHPGLENCVRIVTQAAHSFAARDFAQAFNQIWQAYRVIAMVRAIDPQLPPPHAGAPLAGPASPGPASVH